MLILLKEHHAVSASDVHGEVNGNNIPEDVLVISEENNTYGQLTMAGDVVC